MALTEWLRETIRTGAIERGLESGQVLFRAGDRTVGLYTVLKGRLRLVRPSRSGREAVLQSAGAGESFAEASLYSPAYHCDAIATTAAMVRLYPKAIVLAELRDDPKLAQAFTALLAQQVMALRTRLEGRNLHSARDRVWHFLAVNAGSDGRTVELSGTLKDLAADLGLTHEALYRTLARMEAEGEIKRAGPTIKFRRTI